METGFAVMDSVVLEGIRMILHISIGVKLRSKFYILDTTNSRAVTITFIILQGL
jgi:hypothetical protein